jgi:hypothetical protein
MSLFCSTHFVNDGQLPLSTLAGEIRLLEVRQRSSPTALDDRRTLLLINGLFFAWYHSQVPAFPTEARGGALHKLLFSLLIHENFDKAGYVHRVRTIIRHMLSDEKRIVFLRKAAILEYIVQGDFQHKDWDVELSPERLSATFSVPIHNSVTLPRFTFGGFSSPDCPNGPSLPTSFLDFSRPPHCVDFSVYEELALCLITGDIISVFDPLIHGARTVSELTFRPVLVLRGEKVNSAVICFYAWRTTVDIGPFYFDEFGDPDIGFQHGSVLRLSTQAIDKEVDRLLSHAWTDGLV